MAAADATVYAVKGQAYRVYGWIKDSTTGNAISSIGTLTVKISLDGTYSSTYSSGGGSALTATAVTNHPGRFYVDIPATPMGYYNVGLTVSSNTASSVECMIDIITVVMSEEASAWSAQTVIRLEQAILQGIAYSLNNVTITNADENGSGTLTLYKRDGTTPWLTGTASDDGSTTSKGTLS